MPTTEARIETERPSRYLVQLCKHAAAMGSGAGDGPGHSPRVHLRNMLTRREVGVRAEWSDAEGVITFEPWGRCTLEAGTNTLTLHVEARDEQDLRRIQDILTKDLDRIGRRENLAVNWATIAT
jgi:hypothetical protein